MADAGTTSFTIAELAEFARFSREEQKEIERALDLALGQDGFWALLRDRENQHGVREQHAAYQELRGLRPLLPRTGTFAALETFMGPLLRATAQDLARGRLGSFAAYRFLYERLLGAAVRPWLPAAFCGAAALPQILPERRKALLRTLTEAAATAPGWSDAEPSFFPRSLSSDDG